MSVVVHGRGLLAEHLRGSVTSDIHAAVVVVGVDGSVGVVPVARMTDDLIDAVFEQPMQALIAALQASFTDGCRRIVVVTPTSGLSGANQHAAHAALAESARILVKSAARQWGADGVTVNAVAVDPSWFGIDPKVSGPVAIAPRALVGDVDPAGIVNWLCSEAAHDVTGQTVVCDGGLLM